MSSSPRRLQNTGPAAPTSTNCGKLLKTNGLKAAELLKDSVHLNAHGEWLMAELLKGYLAPLPPQSGYDPLNEARVHTVMLQPKAGQQSTPLEFTGTRVDLVFKPNAKGTISVLIDGNKPSAIPELYGFTRVSPFPASDWPLLLKLVRCPAGGGRLDSQNRLRLRGRQGLPFHAARQCDRRGR